MMKISSILLSTCLFLTMGALSSFSVLADEMVAFSWTADSGDGIALSGTGRTYLSRKAFATVQREIDALAKNGKAKDMQKFSVRIAWKGTVIQRVLMAHSSYPIRR